MEHQGFLRFCLIVFMCLECPLAFAHIYEWAWKDPSDHSQGEIQSTVLCPGGSGVSAVPYASLQTRDLTRAYLVSVDLNHANLQHANLQIAKLDRSDLSSANLTSAYVANATLTDVNLSNADLTNTYFGGTRFTNANFAGAIVHGAYLGGTIGFTAQQLYSTASYQTGDLSGISFAVKNMTGWSFRGKDLTSGSFVKADLHNADLTRANLTDAGMGAANLTGADLRGAQGFAGALSTTNMIALDGTIAGLHLDAVNPLLIVRDYDATTPLPIHIQTAADIEAGSVLQIVVEDAAWGSTISFDPGISVTLVGDLNLGLAAAVDAAGLVGTSFQLFDWTGVTPVGKFNLVSGLPGGFGWNTTELYNTGRVTLIAIPEPSTLALLLMGFLASCAGLAVSRRRGRVTP